MLPERSPAWQRGKEVRLINPILGDIGAEARSKVREGEKHDD
jgi:hypothetical protein